MHFGGIVLCGGKSTRMGASKAALRFGNELMLERVVRLLRQAVEPIVVVAAVDQELPRLPPQVIPTRDGQLDCGPLEGLRAGLTALQNHADAAFVTSCDVPLLVPAFVHQMTQLLESHDVAVPVEEKYFHPLSAVYRVGVLPHITELLAARQLRPVFLYERVSTRRVPVETLRGVDPQLDSLANVNHPEQYHDALRRCGFDAGP